MQRALTTREKDSYYKLLECIMFMKTKYDYVAKYILVAIFVT